jgi:hypothetical protein
LDWRIRVGREEETVKDDGLDRWMHWLMECGFIRSQIGYIDMIAKYPTPIPRDTPDERWQELFGARDELQQQLDELEKVGPWPPRGPGRQVYVCGPAEFRELVERHGVKSASPVLGGVQVMVTKHWPEGMPGKVIPWPERHEEMKP